MFELIPLLVECTGTTAVTLFTNRCLRACMFRVAWYLNTYSILLSSPSPDSPWLGTESNLPVRHPTPGIQVVDYSISGLVNFCFPKPMNTNLNERLDYYMTLKCWLLITPASPPLPASCRSDQPLVREGRRKDDTQEHRSDHPEMSALPPRDNRTAKRGTIATQWDGVCKGSRWGKPGTRWIAE